jgi:hypothetical protein
MDRDTRTKEMEDFKLGEDSAGSMESTVGYTANESPDKDSSGHYVFSEPKQIEPGDEYCYAKKITIKNNNGSIRYKYFVKVGPDGRIFNPWGMFSEGTQGKYSRGRGKLEWKFTDVKEKCFDYYSKFLQSRNAGWLNNAERELR